MIFNTCKWFEACADEMIPTLWQAALRVVGNGREVRTL
jgi:hypothetical protein